MLLYSVLHIFCVQLNLMGESKADKAQTLVEDKGDEKILIVENVGPTGETLVLPCFSKKQDLEGELLGNGIEKSHQKILGFPTAICSLQFPQLRCFVSKISKKYFKYKRVLVEIPTL